MACASAAFPPPPWMRKGGAIAAHPHSGSVYSGLCHNDKRMGFSLAVSAGQELTTTVADYLDFALEMPETRCIGLFLETVRDPPTFVAGLEKAHERDIPVVALKVGTHREPRPRTPLSHSGAIAGNHAAYAGAVRPLRRDRGRDAGRFRQRAAALFGSRGGWRQGGIATMHDSGGLRELTIDLADAARRPVRAISDDTKRKLAARLECRAGADQSARCLGHRQRTTKRRLATDGRGLVEDPATACGIFCVETRDGYLPVRRLCAASMQAAFARTDEAVAARHQSRQHRQRTIVAQRMTEHGIPVLSGIDSALTRDEAGDAATATIAARRAAAIARGAGESRAKWEPRLAARRARWTRMQACAARRLRRAGAAASRRRAASSRRSAAAQRIGYPVVLKTAMPGILHKSDVGGVKLNLRRRGRRACRLRRSGAPSRAARAGHADGGEGRRAGASVRCDDPQFGPLVMVGAGGILIEMHGRPRLRAGAIRHRHARAPARRPQAAASCSTACAARRPRTSPPWPRRLARFSVLAADLAGLSRRSTSIRCLSGRRAASRSMR